MINFFFLFKTAFAFAHTSQADIHAYFMFYGKGQDIGCYASIHKTYVFGIFFLWDPFEN